MLCCSLVRLRRGGGIKRGSGSLCHQGLKIDSVPRMAELIRYELNSGTVLVEVGDGDGISRASRIGELAENAE